MANSGIMFLLEPHLLWHTVTMKRNTVQCFHEWIKIINADQSHSGEWAKVWTLGVKIINLVRKPFSLCLRNLQESSESVTVHCLQQSPQIPVIHYWMWLKWAELNKAEIIGSVAISFPVFMNLCQKKDKMKWTRLICFSLEMKIESHRSSLTNPLYSILPWG